MSRKTTLGGKRLENDKSLASDFQTDALEIEMIDNVAIVIETASVTDNTGTFGVQIRIRENENIVSGWVDLTLSSVPTLADADDSFLINLNQLPPCEIRVKFTAAGGTPDGTCDVFFSGTQI